MCFARISEAMKRAVVVEHGGDMLLGDPALRFEGRCSGIGACRKGFGDPARLPGAPNAPRPTITPSAPD